MDELCIPGGQAQSTCDFYKDEERERLASLAHESWSGWMRYLFEKSERNADGSVTIPKSLVDRWTRQMNAPYSELPDSERESDRKEADKVLFLLGLRTAPDETEK